jgi:hypothetical protein
VNGRKEDLIAMTWLSLLVVTAVAVVVLVALGVIAVVVWLTYRGRGDE